MLAVRRALLLVALAGLAGAGVAVPVLHQPAATAADPVLVAAGDIACDPSDANFNAGAGTTSFCRERATAALLGGASVVVPLGDEQYTDGTLTKFQQSFDPTWGATKSLHRPVPGNHDYLTSGAAGYYDYYGSQAGTRGQGWYSYDVGSWHVVALNGECSFVGGCDAGSPQESWLRSDLAGHQAACTLAYWHEPKFTSVDATNTGAFQAFWDDLYAAGADVVLNGHQHNYERLAPQDPSGRADPKGIREFVVGTGGKDLLAFSGTPLANSEVRNATTYGVLRLTLHSGSYDWQFVPVSGSTFTDSGTGSCGPAPASPSPPASASPPASPSTQPSSQPSSSPGTTACDPSLRASATQVTVGAQVDLDLSGLSPNRPVSLEGYAQPSTAYRQLRPATQPSPDGTLRFTVRPTTNTRLRVQVQGCASPGSSQVLLVRPRLSLVASRTGTRRYTFSGSLSPAAPNVGRVVALYYRTSTGSTVRRAWTSVRSDGSYRVDVQFSGTAQLDFFFATGANAVNTAGTSNVGGVLVH